VNAAKFGLTSTATESMPQCVRSPLSCPVMQPSSGTRLDCPRPSGGRCSRADRTGGERYWWRNERLQASMSIRSLTDFMEVSLRSVGRLVSTATVTG
jgi:hypothetical protein